ncbi:MAG: hypothetical protein PHC62_00585 [Candidatus Izemoplasmatales bacterium]|nr:hypothetical protein [Candidatus Izemoplasmatales bacterium]
MAVFDNLHIFNPVNNKEYLNEVVNLINRQGVTFNLSINRSGTQVYKKTNRYFKFNEGLSTSSDSKAIRISLVEVDYINHFNKSSSSKMIATNQRDELASFLKSQCKTKVLQEDGGHVFKGTNYQYLIYYFNKEICNMSLQETMMYTMKSPHIEFDHGEPLPIDFPMPNYKKLDARPKGKK